MIAAVVAAVGTFLIVMRPRQQDLSDRVSHYLRSRHRGTPAVSTGPSGPPIDAAMPWSHRETRIRRSAATIAGAVAGAIVAQGDLFVAGAGRSLPALAVLGAAAGWLGFGMWLSTRKQQRARRLRFELPVVADAIGLHVIAGESIASAIEAHLESSHGVAAEELALVLEGHRRGTGFAEALHGASRRTCEPEAGRLYSLLGHAHVTGGRLAEALAELAKDLRAGLSRDVTAEGGKRALATYGPVLGLMVPVALLFLLYPTLVGLRELAGGQ